MMNQKDISTWDTEDISNWLKSINMTQYIAKFESNKINGYDLIYLTKEDLKSLGIVNIHDKNVILNSMKDAILKQLKLNLNYKEKSITIQLDFDPNYTVEQLTNALKLIFKPVSSIFLVTSNNEILMPNLKIIDLILYNPKVYKNFKIVLDSQLLNNNYSNNGYTNTNKDILNINNNDNYINNGFSNNNQMINATDTRTIPNKKLYDNYYQYNSEDNYNYNINNNNSAKFNKNDDNNKNNKYLNNLTTIDNNENRYNKTYLEKKQDKYKYNNNLNTNSSNNNNTNTIQYTNDNPLTHRYKTYVDYNTNKDLNINNNDINTLNKTNYNTFDDKNTQNNYQPIENNTNKPYNISNNNIFDYNRHISPEQEKTRMEKTLPEYRKNYTIENGDLNIGIKDNTKNTNEILNYKTVKKQENANQKYPSEKRYFRMNEINSKEKYEKNLNNIGDNNQSKKYEFNYSLNNGLTNRKNYEINSLIGKKEKSTDRMNNTMGFNEYRKFNNSSNLILNYNKVDVQK